MKNIGKLLIILLLFQSCNHKKEVTSQIDELKNYKTIEFSSMDGLTITGNLYHLNNDSPVILLCHQARFNKFEYDGIALKLLEMGFNCMAIDQRSGGPIGSALNQTKIRAKAQGLATDYLDAEQDIISSINYMYEKYNKPIILWGSSYSSTLALYQGISNEKVNAVISFSPGDYFSEEKGSLIDLLEDFSKPLFITSSKSESERAKILLSKVNLNDNQIIFAPQGQGYHGSRALWESQDGGEEYWKAITDFLNKVK